MKCQRELAVHVRDVNWLSPGRLGGNPVVMFGHDQAPKGRSQRGSASQHYIGRHARMARHWRQVIARRYD